MAIGGDHERNQQHLKCRQQRLTKYLDFLAAVAGHADRAVPLSLDCTGLLPPANASRSNRWPRVLPRRTCGGSGTSQGNCAGPEGLVGARCGPSGRDADPRHPEDIELRSRIRRLPRNHPLVLRRTVGRFDSVLPTPRFPIADNRAEHSEPTIFGSFYGSVWRTRSKPRCHRFQALGSLPCLYLCGSSRRSLLEN